MRRIRPTLAQKDRDVDATGDDCAGAGLVPPQRWPFLEHPLRDRRLPATRLTEAAQLRACHARQLPTRLLTLD